MIETIAAEQFGSSSLPMNTITDLPQHTSHSCPRPPKNAPAVRELTRSPPSFHRTVPTPTVKA